MLGWVAAVSATESPSQLSPALIQRMWTTVSSGGASVVVKVASRGPLAEGARYAPHVGLRLPVHNLNGCLCHPFPWS